MYVNNRTKTSGNISPQIPSGKAEEPKEVAKIIEDYHSKGVSKNDLEVKTTIWIKAIWMYRTRQLLNHCRYIRPSHNSLKTVRLAFAKRKLFTCVFFLIKQLSVLLKSLIFFKGYYKRRGFFWKWFNFSKESWTCWGKQRRH